MAFQPRQVLLIFILMLQAALPLKAQESLIETATHYKEAIVTVRSVQLRKNGGLIAQFTNQASGVIIDSNGTIVTNLHTIRNVDKIGIILHNNLRLGARIVELWPQHDLALLKITPPLALTAMPLADSDRLQLGDEIINIGTSYYRQGTLTGGKITGLGRSNTTNTLEIIQVDLELFEGDSGGALLNRNGELIGMLSSKNMKKTAAAYAIPSNKIKNLYLKAMK